MFSYVRNQVAWSQIVNIKFQTRTIFNYTGKNQFIVVDSYFGENDDTIFERT